MMRILHVIQGLVKGGAERLCLEIAQEINRNYNHQIVIVALDSINEYPELVKGLDLRFANCKFELSVFGKSFIDISEFEYIVDDFKPEIIHSHTYKAEIISRENIRPGIKYFTHCHNNIPELKRLTLKTIFSKKLFTRFIEKLRLEKRYIKCNNQFIAISNDTYKFFYDNLHPFLKKNIYLLPNAIKFSRFSFADTRSIKSDVNLTMIGHMSDYKNQIFLIPVLKYLRNKNIHASLTLIGDWRNNGVKILEKAKLSGLEDYVAMPGNIENVEETLKNQNIYVHSAYYEPFGLVLLEAMASGLPVVCLDGGGNRDIIENGNNGFLVESQNPEIFAEKIIELIEHPDLYTKMSVYARQYAKKYDIGPYVDRLLDLYQSTL